MDDTTKKIAQALAVGAVKKGLMALGAAAAAHGLSTGGLSAEVYGGIALAIVSAGWSFWNDYGKAIVLSQLEVMKAKSLAQADQARKAGLPPVTAAAIADKSPTLTTTDVAKVVTNLLIAAFVCSLFLAGGDGAMAQTQIRKPQITGDFAADAKVNLGLGGQSSPASTGLNNILGALDDKLMPDLKYALTLATASGSRVTAPCYQAWIDIITTRQKAVTNADGSPMDLPNPRLITDFEKAVELRNALQPDSEFMIKCSPVASMVKKDITGFIGVILSGGAGLATLVPGL